LKKNLYIWGHRKINEIKEIFLNKMDINKIELNREFLWRIRKDWEKNFPDLPGEWTHYQIKGDDYEIAVVDGLDLIKALDIVEENFGRFKKILVHRAKIDSEGLYVYEKNNNYYISTYNNDILQMDRLKKFHDRNTL